MVEKKKSLFLRIIRTVLLIIIFEAIAFSFSYFVKEFTELPPPEALKIFFNSTPPIREFIFAQALLLGLIALFLTFKEAMHIKKRKAKIEYNIKELSRGSSTSLDTLYKLLQKKKSLNIGFIADVFGIKRDLAMEWSRILESGGLATLDYPGIGSPSLEIINEHSKEKMVNNLPKKLPQEIKGAKEEVSKVSAAIRGKSISKKKKVVKKTSKKIKKKKGLPKKKKLIKKKSSKAKK